MAVQMVAVAAEVAVWSKYSTIQLYQVAKFDSMLEKVEWP